MRKANINHFAFLMLSLTLLTGCFAGGEDEVSSEILALEANYPVMSDVHLESGEQTLLFRSDGSRAFSYEIPGGHMQRFEPLEGYTLGDVATELVEVAEQAGFVVEEKFEGTGWCGEDDQPGNRRGISISVAAQPIVPDLEPHVSLEISRIC